MEARGAVELLIMDRRKFLLGSAASVAAASGIVRPARADNVVKAGAIRWSPWYGSVNTPSVVRSLGPKEWQFRAPWFSRSLGNFAIDINGNKQEIIDTEIRCAKNAGLDYWIYLWYDNNLDGGPETDSGMMNPWRLHQSSSIKSQMNWCLMWGLSSLHGSAGLARDTAKYISYLQQSNYQKTSDGRPIIYCFGDVTPAAFYGWSAGWTTFAASITAFRNACISAGLQNPYLIMSTGSVSYFTSSTFDALGNYAQAAWGTYPQLVANVQSSWATFGAQVNIVPWCVMGWDTRPRQQYPVSWGIGPPYRSMRLNTRPEGTISERVAHVSAGIDYVKNNAAQCPAGIISIYAWDECDEGGGMLIPTLGDTWQVGDTTNFLTALSAVLN